MDSADRRPCESDSLVRVVIEVEILSPFVPEDSNVL